MQSCFAQPVAQYWGDTPGYSPITGKSIHWPGGATSAPPDEPFCGFMYEKERCVPKGIVILRSIRSLVRAQC